MENILSYWKGFVNYSLNSIIFIIAISLFVWLFALVFSFYFNKNQKFNPIYNFYKSWFSSITFTLFTLTAISVFFSFYNHLIKFYNLELIILFCFLLLCFLLVYLCIQFYKRNINSKHGMVGVQISMQKIFEQIKIFKNDFNRTKWFYLIVFIPFILLLVKPNKKYLYSIFLDNSLSMEVQVQYARETLNSTINSLNDNATYVITTIPKYNDTISYINKMLQLKQNIEDITKVNNPNVLIGNTNIFFNKIDFSEYLASENADITLLGSPLYEGIWQNYLTSVNEAKKNVFSKKKLIIITDGADNFYANNLNVKNCMFNINLVENSPSSFYDEISFINFGGQEGKNMFATCQYPVYDGNNYEDFKKSFLSQVDEIYIDYFFLKIIGSILLLTFIINILIKGKNN